MEPVRVRYAPSPTGEPHVGNIRTALFNWLLARQTGGSFIVRIEDTDQARKVEGAVESILESLRWLGLDWDEGPEVGGDYGPYFQSERLDIYQPIAKKLVEEGHAYLCYCSPQRLEEMRAEQMRRKEPPRYDRRCRELTEGDRLEKEREGTTPVVRFKTPLKDRTSFTDLLRGEVIFDNSSLDDFVILKADGYPTYHLANVVDDHMMEISHIMRADEWLSSTPRHILLYRALGYEPPQFAHLPMILGDDRSKLSKRHGATSLLEYREQGYLPEAMMNFLALLGWSLDDKTEIIGRDQLIEHFSLERIGVTGAIFSQEKLAWMNGMYLRQLNLNEFSEKAIPFLEKGLPASISHPLPEEYIKQILPLVQERIKTLGDLPQLTEFFFIDEFSYDAEQLIQQQKGMTKKSALEALRLSKGRLETIAQFDAKSLEEVLRPLAEEVGLKTGQLFGALRVAVTGRPVAPPLFQTMAVLGRERCLKRIQAALEKLES